MRFAVRGIHLNGSPSRIWRCECANQVGRVETAGPSICPGRIQVLRDGSGLPVIGGRRPVGQGLDRIQIDQALVELVMPDVTYISHVRHKAPAEVALDSKSPVQSLWRRITQ